MVTGSDCVSIGGAMRRNIALLLLLSLIFTACGQGGSPGDGGTPPGGDGPPPGGPGSLNCRETVTGNITSATTWRNGPEEIGRASCRERENGAEPALRCKED